MTPEHIDQNVSMRGFVDPEDTHVNDKGERVIDKVRVHSWNFADGRVVLVKGPSPGKLQLPITPVNVKVHIDNHNWLKKYMED